MKSTLTCNNYRYLEYIHKKRTLNQGRVIVDPFSLSLYETNINLSLSIVHLLLVFFILY